jgi:hypothetical protein
MTCLSPSREQRIPQFLTLEMGDGKPSQFLRQQRSLVPDVPDDFLCKFWSSRLPPNVRAISACQPEGDLEAVGRCADRIIEAATQPALTSVVPLPDSNALTRQIADLSRQVASFSTELTHLRSNYKDLRPQNRKQRLGKRSPPERTLRPPSEVPSPLRSLTTKVYSALLLQPARKTDAADINCGSCLHPKYRPPFRHGWGQ